MDAVSMKAAAAAMGAAVSSAPDAGPSGALAAGSASASAMQMSPTGRPRRQTANNQPSYADTEDFWDTLVSDASNEEEVRLKALRGQPSPGSSGKGKGKAASSSPSGGGSGVGGYSAITSPFPRQLVNNGGSAGTSKSASPTPAQSAGGGAASASDTGGAGAAAAATSSPNGANGYVVAGTNQRLSLSTIAADSARLDADTMSVKEQQIFSDWVASPALKNLFLKMRNGILAIWYQNCYTELTLAIALRTAPKGSTGFTAERYGGVFKYLNHAGFINFGVFKQRPQPTIKPGQRRRKVVVIGAGVSGLAAARKLHSLGYEVLTLEGKDYVGGRVNSYKWGKYTADLGAMVITGLGGGNPLYTLCRQVNLKTYSVRGVCPLHDHTGKRIGKQLDDELEHEFNALLDETRSIGKHAKKMPELSDKKLSLGDAFNMAVKVSMRRCQNMWSSHLSKITHILQQLDHITTEIVTAERELLELCKRKRAAEEATLSASASIKVEMDVDPLTAEDGPPTVATPSSRTATSPSSGGRGGELVGHAMSSLDPLLDLNAGVRQPPPATGLPPPATIMHSAAEVGAGAGAGDGGASGQAVTAPSYLATLSTGPAMMDQQHQEKLQLKLQLEREQREKQHAAADAQREKQQSVSQIDRETQQLHDKIAQIGGLKATQESLEAERRKLSALYPTKYWTGTAKSVIDWHVANLEFANATTLDTLSLEHWDQDDANEFSGEHLTVKDGFGTVPKALATGLNVKMKTRVTNVQIDPSFGARVSFRGVASNPTGPCDDEEVVEADAVLVTVPLGVLKDGAMKFDPPLPGWKTSAIERLGFGLLNKVILCFETAFWTAKFDTFGCCSPPSGIVGELYMFWNFMPCTGQPILLALNAGEAAKESEKETDEVVIAKAVAVLRNVFSAGTVPEPVHAHVTRWRKDEFARGSYSYVSVDATGDDYDQLAEPVTLDGAANPQLFFAGEHTNRNYPATVHGAMLSGLREAGRIADTFPPCMASANPSSATAVTTTTPSSSSFSSITTTTATAAAAAAAAAAATGAGAAVAMPGAGAAATGAAVATAPAAANASGISGSSGSSGPPPPATALPSSELGIKRKPEALDAPPLPKKIAM